jgi:hypothetical protein
VTVLEVMNEVGRTLDELRVQTSTADTSLEGRADLGHGELRRGIQSAGEGRGRRRSGGKETRSTLVRHEAIAVKADTSEGAGERKEPFFLSDFSTGLLWFCEASMIVEASMEHLPPAMDTSAISAAQQTSLTICSDQSAGITPEISKIAQLPAHAFLLSDKTKDARRCL